MSKDKKISLRTLLNANNYHTYNRKLALLIGLEAAIFLSELIDKYEYFEGQNTLVDIEGESGWFYMTIDDVYKRTSLKRNAQNTAIKKLEDLKLLKLKQKGLPSKRHFLIIQENFTSLLDTTDLSSANKYVESNNLDCGIQQTDALPAYTDKKNPTKEMLCSVEGDASSREHNGKQGGSFSKKKSDGSELVFNESEVFRLCIQNHPDWTTPEIEYAFEAARNVKGPINSIDGFMRGTIQKFRNKNRANTPKAKKEKKCKPSRQTTTYPTAEPNLPKNSSHQPMERAMLELLFPPC